ncbi:MAG: DUF99 family protein [Candidatus Bathyarchaeia archaeon]
MNVKRFRSIKPEIRVLGIDDGVFVPREKGLVDIIGVVYRGGYWLDGVMRTEVELDGMDATEKIIQMIRRSPHHKQLRVVMLNGVTFAGFNVVNIKELYEKVGLPVIVVSREKPDLEKIKKALENLPFSEKRWEAIEKAGELFEMYTRNNYEPIFVQFVGISQKDVQKILKVTSTRSNIPEALRVAHIIASGLSKVQEKET